MQIVVPKVAVPWQSIDLSLLDDAAREDRWEQILAEDRAEHFDLATPPLLRCALVRLGADRHRSYSPSITSCSMAGHPDPGAGAVHALCAQGQMTCALPRAMPYRDYLAWLAAQDRAAALAAWHEALAGLEEPTRLAPHDPGRARRLRPNRSLSR